MWRKTGHFSFVKISTNVAAFCGTGGDVLKKALVTGCLTVISVAFVAGQAPKPRQASSSAVQRPAAAAQRPTVSPTSPAPDLSKQRALLDQYCVVCHNAKLKTANLLLDQLDLSHLSEHGEIGEHVIRKLRAGMMPPAGMKRPDPATLESMIRWMEGEFDRAAVTYVPPPGIHRLNRTEYANAIRDLLALEVDPTKFLPSDDSTRGFDNMDGALTMEQ